MVKPGKVRTGIGGWMYPPWQDTFYPPDIKSKDILRHAASKLAAIEINATFYRTQTAATFASWASQVPDGFRFAVKATRGAAQRKDPQEARAPIERFLNSGLAELGDRLGPVLWQFPTGRVFDPDAFPRFLDLLPDRLDGLPLHHAIEAAHDSFLSGPALALLSERGMARVVLEKEGVETRATITAPFVYLRLQGTISSEEAGYPREALVRWAAMLTGLAIGAVPPPLRVPDTPTVRPGARDVFCFVIAGAKERAPAAAMALADLL